MPRRNALFRFIPVALVLTVVACGRYAQVLVLDPTPRPATLPDSIRLIAQEPEQPYTVIALVSAYSKGWPLEGLPRARLLREAARLGGEAVLLDIGSLSEVASDEGRQQVLRGKVIVFKPTGT
jgi:hypothetical protein